MTVQQPVSVQPMTALVTGATSGLGREIAERLARDGMDVIVVGRDAARGAAVVSEIEEAGGRARFIAADLSNPAEIRRLAEEVGEIDVLVNNAGQSVLGPTESVTAQDFDSIFAINVRAPFTARRRVRPAMAAKGAGSIVNISAMAGGIGVPGGAAYGATKAALASLTQGWTAGVQPARGARQRGRRGPSTPAPKPASAPTSSATRQPCTGRPSPARSPKSSPSSLLTTSQLRHRRHRRRRRRAHRDLAPALHSPRRALRGPISGDNRSASLCAASHQSVRSCRTSVGVCTLPRRRASGPSCRPRCAHPQGGSAARLEHARLAEDHDIKDAQRLPDLRPAAGHQGDGAP